MRGLLHDFLWWLHRQTLTACISLDLDRTQQRTREEQRLIEERLATGRMLQHYDEKGAA